MLHDIYVEYDDGDCTRYKVEDFNMEESGLIKGRLRNGDLLVLKDYRSAMIESMPGYSFKK